MTKLTLKVLLGIGGAGVACGAAVGLFYGLKNISFASTQVSDSDSDSSDSRAPTWPSDQARITCRGEDGQLEFETPNGMQIDSDSMNRLRSEISSNRGNCLTQ